MPKPIQLHFDSVADMLHYIETMPILTKGSSNLDRGGDNDFTMTKNLAEAIALVEGWQEGVKRVATFANPIISRITSLIHHQDITYDVSGHSFDVDRVLANEPESWVNYEQSIQESAGTRIIRICANLSVSGGVSFDQIAVRGSFVAALVQCLELAGFSVELFAVCATAPSYKDKGSTAFHETIIKLKSPDQELDIARLAYCLFHPSFFRRLWFAVIERNPEAHHMASLNYGFPSDSEFEKTCDLFFPKQFLGEHFTEARMIQILESQGVKLEEVPHNG